MEDTNTKPGLQFEARVQELARRYKTIDKVFRHMSLGQVSRYYEKNSCIYFKDGTLVYNETTGEIYESI